MNVTGYTRANKLRNGTSSVELAPSVRVNCIAPSLTRIIRSLEERGIITKSKDDNDGRRVLLQITPAGLAIIHEVAPESRLIYNRLERRFGSDKIEQLLDMLDELAVLNDRD